MILSDSEIIRRIELGDLKVESLGWYDIMNQIWPASLDMRLGNVFRFYKRDGLTLIDPKVPVGAEHIETITIDDGRPFILHPRQFVLGVSVEKMRVPYDLVARCEGRSSLWRLGIIIHSTAGFVDPGFEWTITLEITNINEVPVALYPGMRIGQFAFETILWEVKIPYDVRQWSKYMNQALPETSRIFDDK